MAQSSNRLREALTAFPWPRESWLTEWCFDSRDAEAVPAPAYHLFVAVSLPGCPYDSIFDFWADTLRCYAENFQSKIMASETWTEIGNKITCSPVSTEDFILECRSWLDSFSPRERPALPQDYRAAFTAAWPPLFTSYFAHCTSPQSSQHYLALIRSPEVAAA